MGAEFVSEMENVLGIYHLPYNPQRPVVCLDEKVYYLLSTPHGIIAQREGQPERIDYEYKRQGTCNLFVMIEPKAGFRHVVVRQQRTALDYALTLKWLVDEGYRECEEIWLIQDNLNTHRASALYKAFEPAEAERIMRRIRWIYTPKHASWLNMAEIEIGVFERQCLARRIESRLELEQQVAALEKERNEAEAKINWQFTCEQSRITLQRLYPKLAGFEEPV